MPVNHCQSVVCTMLILPNLELLWEMMQWLEVVLLYANCTALVAKILPLPL